MIKIQITLAKKIIDTSKLTDHNTPKVSFDRDRFALSFDRIVDKTNLISY